MSLTPAVAEAIDTAVAAAAADHHVPSLAVAVVRGGRIVHAATGGPTPATPATVFRIASMTKSFTAAAVLALRDDGLLRLDDPVAEHVPQLRGLRAPWEDSEAVTVRHLLTMAAGLATDDAWADRHLHEADAVMDELFAGGATFAHAPGMSMTYSNFGYAMLGRTITAVTGRPYAEVITDRLLRPLGLHHTVWEAADLPAGTAVAAPHLATDDGDDGDGGAVPDEVEPLAHGGFGAMGGLWSNLEDLARWVGWFCDAFPARDDPDAGPVRRATRREQQQVHRAYGEPRLTYGDDGALGQVGLGYAMGLQVAHHLQLGTVVTHSGGLPGYGSNMRWLPQRDLGVVALANVTYAPMYRLTQELLELMGRAGALPAPHPVDTVEVDRAATALVELLGDWDDERAAAVFADNVALDEPWDRRRAKAAAFVERCGVPLELGEVRAESRCEAEVTVSGPHGSATVDFQLTPTVPPRIQSYDVA